jgi:DNA-binding NtrC family response regulator
LIATHGRIELTDLEQEGGVPPSTKVHGEVEELFARSYNDAKETVIRRFNEQYLKKLLASHNGNVTMAAQTCGLSRQALQRIMRSHHIISSDYKTRT